MTSARTSLWPDRWPAIAHHVLETGKTCVQTVEEAPPDQRAEVKFGLPCSECPKRTACLNAKRKGMGPLLYDREMRTRPRSSESSLFPYESFEPILRHDEVFVPYYHKPFGMEHRWAVASAWDLAWSANIGGDWMVKMTGLLDRQTGKRKIIDILRVQRLTFTQQVKLIEAEWGKFTDDVVAIESDAAQKVWSQYMAATTPVPVMPHPVGAGKDNLETGIPKLILSLEAQRYELPFSPGTYHHDNAEVFLAEAEAFGWVDDKLQGVGEHDDTVMAWWHLDWALDRLQAASNAQKQKAQRVTRGRYI